MLSRFLILAILFSGASVRYGHAQSNAVADIPVVRDAVVTTTHGAYPNPDVGDGNWTHVGVDLAAECGTPIFAYADGRVVDVIDAPSATNFDTLGYMVIIEHPQVLLNKIFYTLYLHMKDSPAVNIDDIVKGSTTIIGKVGQTGKTVGDCHTHFEVRYFSSRFHTAWGNIYGRGNQSGSELLKSAWEDPVELFSRFPHVITAQARENVVYKEPPLPRTYGIYAFDDNGLVRVDGTGAVEWSKRKELKPDVVFVVFSRSFVDGFSLEDQIELRKVAFVRNEIVFPYFYQLDWKRKEPKVTPATERQWLTIWSIDEFRIPMDYAPMSDNKDVIVARPQTELDPGMYDIFQEGIDSRLGGRVAVLRGQINWEDYKVNNCVDRYKKDIAYSKWIYQKCNILDEWQKRTQNYPLRVQ